MFFQGKLMKSMIIMTILALLIIAVTVKESLSAPSQLNEVQKQMVKKSNTFGFELLKKLLDSEKPGTNIIFSPVSVTGSLMMTGTGAAGETKRALWKTLGLGQLTAEQVSQNGGGLFENIESSDKDVLLNGHRGRSSGCGRS